MHLPTKKSFASGQKEIFCICPIRNLVHLPTKKYFASGQKEILCICLIERSQKKRLARVVCQPSFCSDPAQLHQNISPLSPSQLLKTANGCKREEGCILIFTLLTVSRFTDYWDYRLGCINVKTNRKSAKRYYMRITEAGCKGVALMRV